MENIIFQSRDELLRLTADTVVCFKADGNYTTVVLANGAKYVVCVNLGQVEQGLACQLGEKAARFLRVGKSHIINRAFVQHLNVPKQRIILSDGRSRSWAVEVSREAIKNLKSLILQ